MYLQKVKSKKIRGNKFFVPILKVNDEKRAGSESGPGSVTKYHGFTKLVSGQCSYVISPFTQSAIK
jgi:hypothetical protein